MKKVKPRKDGRPGAQSLVEVLRKNGSRTVSKLLEAFFIWLFGVLVFIPLARDLGWRTEVAISLLVFAAFSMALYRALPGAKLMIDALSQEIAEKRAQKRSEDSRETAVLFRHSFYLVAMAILYLLYLPFLLSFSAALAGIALIALILLGSVLVLRILPTIGRVIMARLT